MLDISTNCCDRKGLAVFKVVDGETRVDVQCTSCKKILETNLPHAEAVRRGRKGNFNLIEPDPRHPQ